MNYFLTDGSYYIVDLPGYGYAKVSKAERAFFANLINPYLKTRSELAGIVQLLDARHWPVAGDYQMLDWLRESGRRVLYVLTKADKLSGNGRQRMLKEAVEHLGSKNCIMSSSLTGMGADDIRSWIAESLALAGQSDGNESIAEKHSESP
jgi:GTP-binding protein